MGDELKSDPVPASPSEGFDRTAEHNEPRHELEQRTSESPPVVASRGEDLCTAWIQRRVRCSFFKDHAGDHSFDNASFLRVRTRLRAVAKGEADPDIVAQDFSVEMMQMVGDIHAHRDAQRTSEATPGLVRCWRCKHDVPEETTVCNAGVGTQCKDAKACRGRWYVPPATTTATSEAWTVEQWQEDGPMCTRCYATLGWDGDPPESEEDAICHDCAWKELHALRGARRPTEALPESDGFDPEHCPTCKAFENRNRPPAPPVEVKSELWDSAMLKMRQLQAEIQACSATPAQKSNMLHSHSKLCMFATDAWEKHVLRPAQRAPRPAAPSKGDGNG